MEHPIVGLWQVEVELDGEVTHVTHAYHADGLMQLHSGEHGASFRWDAHGERTIRFRGVRPIEPQAFRFIGWQQASGEGEVDVDGSTFTGYQLTDAPSVDGERVRRRARLIGSRVEL